MNHMFVHMCMRVYVCAYVPLCVCVSVHLNVYKLRVEVAVY